MYGLMVCRAWVLRVVGLGVLRVWDEGVWRIHVFRFHVSGKKIRIA